MLPANAGLLSAPIFFAALLLGGCTSVISLNTNPTAEADSTDAVIAVEASAEPVVGAAAETEVLGDKPKLFEARDRKITMTIIEAARARQRAAILDSEAPVVAETPRPPAEPVTFAQPDHQIVLPEALEATSVSNTSESGGLFDRLRRKRAAAQTEAPNAQVVAAPPRSTAPKKAAPATPEVVATPTLTNKTKGRGLFDRLRNKSTTAAPETPKKASSDRGLLDRLKGQSKPEATTEATTEYLSE